MKISLSSIIALTGHKIQHKIRFSDFSFSGIKEASIESRNPFISVGTFNPDAEIFKKFAL